MEDGPGQGHGGRLLLGALGLVSSCCAETAAERRLCARPGALSFGLSQGNMREEPGESYQCCMCRDSARSWGSFQYCMSGIRTT